MPNPDDRPRVFISFAGDDRPAAKKLKKALEARRISTFLDEHAIEAGENIITAIGKAISQSDYFVLLWSRHTVDREWVTAEWTVALARDLNERRAFFFLVRLDETDVPPILSTRKYLDGFSDWDGTVARLASTWNRDRAAGTPVIPPPETSSFSFPDVAPIGIYVRNRSLSVSIPLSVSAECTGPDLQRQVRSALRLPDRVPQLDGLVKTRIEYTLEFKRGPIADRPLAEQGITENSTVDLLVSIDIEGGGEVLSSLIYRAPETPTLDPNTVQALINAAFDHIRPW